MVLYDTMVTSNPADAIEFFMDNFRNSKLISFDTEFRSGDK